jgi:glycopeptide antibiotics resistance protein
MKRITFFLYLIVLLTLAVFPLQKAGFPGINDVYVLELRLDYLIHTIIFLPWVFLCEFSFKSIIKHRKLIIIMLGIFIAAAAEFIQMALPYRAFNINDIIFNIAGVLLGSISWLIYKKGNQKEENIG